jgi:hypothetical protein
MQAGAQMWEASYQALFEGWRQAQEFWNNMARSWGEVTGAWLGQSTRSRESVEVLHELQEGAFAVAQAWMRLPLLLVGGAQPEELQDAVAQLTQAQGRAYQLWLEALKRTSEAAKSADSEKK